MSTLVVIEHEPGCPLDRFDNWLDRLEIVTVRPYAGDPVPTEVDGGLLVLGGQMSAYDDRGSPWLPATRRLLSSSASAGVPTLGICLGAQLLAVACGGAVDVGAAPGRESGVVDVLWRTEATADPLVRHLPEPFPGPSMHADAVTRLPAGATWLAETAMYPIQAFRVGTAAWGVQFHPEVSAATFRRWAEGHPEVDTEAVTSELRARDAEVAAGGEAMARRFAAFVTGRA